MEKPDWVAGARAHKPAALSGKSGGTAGRAASVCDAAKSARKMPDRRKGYTQQAVGRGHKVYLAYRRTDDGRTRRDLHRLQQEGAALRSIINTFAIAIQSLGLQ